MDGKKDLFFPYGATTSLLWEFIEMNKCQSAENPTYEHMSCARWIKDICPQEVSSSGAHLVFFSEVSLKMTKRFQDRHQDVPI